MSQIAAIVLWVVGAFLTITWAIGVRIKAARGLPLQPGIVTIAALFAIALLSAVLLHSPFHLLWMLPLSWILGQFRPLHWIGSVYSSLMTVGVDIQRARQKQEILLEFMRLRMQGSSDEEAFQVVYKRSPELVLEIGPAPFKEVLQFMADTTRLAASHRDQSDAT